MNRSIFQIWKTVELNKVPKRRFFFKYLETSKYKCTKPEFLKFSFKFENKIKDHYCSKFIIYENKMNKYTNSYLTLNTSEGESKTSELIGKIIHNNELKNQYLNYNYQLITTKETDKLFIKTFGENELKKANEIHEILINSDKIPIIEYKLNKGLEFFNNCYKHTQKFNDCYQTLMVDYGDNAVIIAKMFFHNYI